MGLAVYRQLAAEIRRKILDGTLPVGAPLPRERELAGAYFVSPYTVQRCVKLLAAQGFVRSVPGHGVYVYVADNPAVRSFRRVLAALDDGRSPEAEDVAALRDLVVEFWTAGGT